MSRRPEVAPRARRVRLRRGVRLAAGLWALILACGDDANDGVSSFPPRANGPAPVVRPAQCSEADYPAVAATSSGVVNGTEEPTATPLTRGQRNALVAVWSRGVNALVCTGTFIGPTTVITAAHCVDGSTRPLQVRLGPRALDPVERIEVSTVTTHPTADVAILQLRSAPRTPVTPLPIGGEGLSSSQFIEMVGYGTREDGFDERRFVSSVVTFVGSEEVEVNGQGRQGLCFGDSGGPGLWLSPSGRRVEIVGVLSGGDSTCTDRDRYARLSTLRAFIEAEISNPPDSYPPVCDGDLTAEGACTADGALRTCGPDGPAITPCPTGTNCAWSSAASAYDCVGTAASACGDLTQLGACNGDVLSWCDAGVLESRDCAACGGSCRPVNGTGAFGCADAACADLPARGRCAQDVVEYCDAAGRLRQLDCRGIGQVCSDDGTRARCVVPPGLCNAIGFQGTCVDGVAVYCQGNSLQWVNCIELGTTCGFVDAQTGFFCLN